MLKCFFVLLLFFCWYPTIGQKQLPTIKASSAIVDIRVGNDYFAKGGWTLEPKKKPDIFSIGSKWPYNYKRVTFITDIDSISFNARPGGKYDFVILLNQQTPCHIRIVTLANPVFMQAKIVIPISIGITILLILAYLKRRTLNSVYLLHFGYIVPLLFWLMVFISGQLHGKYNHARDVISELGAIGTLSEIFTSSAFVFLALLSTLFSIGFYKASESLKISVIPAVLSFSKPVSLTWAAIFPLGNELHSFTGPLPFLILLGSLLVFLLYKPKKELVGIRIMSLLSFIIMLLIFTRFIKPFGYEYEGLVQRLFYIGWTVWFMTISYFLIKKLGRSTTIVHQVFRNEQNLFS